jgi:dihydrofolate reductase
MSKELILSMTMSVDGFVADANGEVDWMVPARSDEGRRWVAEQMWFASLLAMGRRSYHEWADFWPTAANANAGPMNEIPKAVFSRSGKVSLPSMEKTTASQKAEPAGATIAVQKAIESWLHPFVTGQDLVADVQRLKAEDGKPILAIGGNSFASSLIKASLVDVFRLVVHPVVLGHGLPLFGELEAPLRMKLEDLKRFDSGVVVQTYRPSYSQ